MSRWRHDDAGLSRVFVTVFLVGVVTSAGATVYLVVAPYTQVSFPGAPDVAFRARALDTDADGRSDSIQITYLTGPSEVSPDRVAVRVVSDEGGAPLPEVDARAWSPGDFVVVSHLGPGPYRVNVTVAGEQVLLQRLVLGE